MSVFFVTKSSWEKEKRRAEEAERALKHQCLQYEMLRGRWNSLVEEVNKRGGQAFLDHAQIGTTFSDDDLRKLLMLCHPDKHGGKPMATEMTTRLNAMRKEKA